MERQLHTLRRLNKKRKTKNFPLLSKIVLVFAVFGQLGHKVNAQQPIINNVSGPISDGQQITITGNNFGSDGPNVILFDDFKRGIDGQNITLNATIGTWDSKSTPTYENDNYGNIAGRFIGNNGGKLKYRFDDTKEIYISYRVIIPSGEHFPNTTAPNTFSNGSDWKLVWLMDGTTGRGAAGNDDLCLPTSNNPEYFTIAGNDNAFQTKVGRKSGNLRWFSFQDWNRFSVYMKGGQNPTVDQGTVWAQGMSEEFGQKVFEDNPVLFDGDDTPDGYQFEDDAISRWNQLNVPGWFRGGSVNPGALYDDIYVATGECARARVEIGNHANYDSCSVLAISTPNSWSDNSITFTLREGAFQSLNNLYVYIIDCNGVPNDNGYPLNSIATGVINNEILDNNITLYPNPVENRLNILSDVEILNAVVRDIAGKQVEVTYQNKVIDVSSLSKGNYTINFETEEGTVIKKFIKK